MQRADAMIAAVVIVAAVGSGIGVFTYEEDRRASLFDVAYALQTVTLETGPQTHTASGEVVVQLPVALRNLTRIDLSVTVTGGGPRVQSESVEVEVRPPGYGPVTGPDAALPPGGSATVEVPVEVVLGPLPETATVRASDPAAARQRLNATDGTERAVGTWTIVVRFGAALPGVLDAEAHTVSVRAQAQAYEATVSLQAPRVNR